jgi:hypothetical protein
MGRHAGPPNTLDAVVSDYVTGRAKELVRQYDIEMANDPAGFDWPAWEGHAVEMLRELTRDA